MKILLVGTHFTPAQAIIEELTKYPGVELIYIGREYTMDKDPTPSVESRIFPRLGIKFIPLSSGRLTREISFFTLISLLKIPLAVIKSAVILLRESPDVVVSFGGYLALPVVVNAWLLSIPVIVHEQTLVAGLSNRISSVFANKVAVSYKKSFSFPKDKLLYTGNPLRKEFVRDLRELPLDRKTVIVILGGNQGSVAINKAVWGCLDSLTQLGLIVHQTGQSKYGNFQEAMALKKKLKNPDQYRPLPWIEVEELVKYLNSATLVISRSGANTLYELAYLGIPTLTIPLPWLINSEQTINARYFKEKGLCQILPQNELNPARLLEKVSQMVENKKSLRQMAREAQKTVISDASKRLTQEVLILGEKLN